MVCAPIASRPIGPAGDRAASFRPFPFMRPASIPLISGGTMRGPMRKLHAILRGLYRAALASFAAIGF